MMQSNWMLNIDAFLTTFPLSFPNIDILALAANGIKMFSKWNATYYCQHIVSVDAHACNLCSSDCVEEFFSLTSVQIFHYVKTQIYALLKYAFQRRWLAKDFPIMYFLLDKVTLV